MYCEVYALPSAFAAATEVHTGKEIWPTRVLSAGDTLIDSSKKDVPTERGVVSAAADEDPTREGSCGGGWRRYTGWYTPVSYPPHEILILWVLTLKNVNPLGSTLCIYTVITSRHSRRSLQYFNAVQIAQM